MPYFDVSPSLILTIIFGLLGAIGTGSFIYSWWKGKEEFKRIKKCIRLELLENLDLATEIVSTAKIHGFPIPLFRDEVWHLLLSSEQLKKFGGQRVEDPIYELGYIYRKMRYINQVILSRQYFIFSSFRAMGDLYKKTLNDTDNLIIKEINDVFYRTEKAIKALMQKNIICAFRKIEPKGKRSYKNTSHMEGNMLSPVGALGVSIDDAEKEKNE